MCVVISLKNIYNKSKFAVVNIYNFINRILVFKYLVQVINVVLHNNFYVSVTRSSTIAISSNLVFYNQSKIL